MYSFIRPFEEATNHFTTLNVNVIGALSINVREIVVKSKAKYSVKN